MNNRNKNKYLRILIIAVTLLIVYQQHNGSAGILTKRFLLYCPNKSKAIVMVNNFTGEVTHVWDNRWVELKKDSSARRFYQNLYNLQKDIRRDEPELPKVDEPTVLHKEFQLMGHSGSKSTLKVNRFTDEVDYIWQNNEWVRLKGNQKNSYQNQYDLQKGIERDDPGGAGTVSTDLITKEFELYLPNKSKARVKVGAFSGNVTHLWINSRWVKLSENPRRYYQNLYDLQKDIER